MKKDNNGITLIALVITIIVLLILAGISISLLMGNNGVVQNAANAKTKTEKAQIIEKAKMDLLGETIANYGKDLSESQLKSVLEKYFINSEIPDELPEDLSSLELTTLDTKNKIKVSEIYDGNIVADTIIPVLASTKLIINESSENDYEKSPYVNYVDKNGNTILCRVLYDSSSTYGIEIISNDVIEGGDVTIGYGDLTSEPSEFGYTGSLTLSDNKKIAGASYNKAINTLNAKARSYLSNDGIAESARCVGGKPDSPDDTTQNYATTNYSPWKENGWGNNVFKVSFKNDTIDTTQLKKLGIFISKSNTFYWLASRFTDVDVSRNYDGMGAIYGCVAYSHSIYTGWHNIFWVTKDSVYADSFSLGIRPVFKLSENAKVVSGKGTENNPYNLGLN